MPQKVEVEESKVVKEPSPKSSDEDSKRDVAETRTSKKKISYQKAMELQR